LAKVTAGEVKQRYSQLSGVPAWQLRLISGEALLSDGEQLVSHGLRSGDSLHVVSVQNLSTLPGLGSGWVLYMFNGADFQYVDDLMLGQNSDGIGDPGVVLNPEADQSGCYKMSERSFDEHGFDEVAAVGSDHSWVLIRRGDGGAIPASDAFKIGGSAGYQFIFSNGLRSDSSANRTNAAVGELHWASFGPFFDDALYHNVLDGSGWQWMWSAHRSDKGTVLGSSSWSESHHLQSRLGGYAWAWYGRVAAEAGETPAACAVPR
jgi:hypothetical protein